VLVALGAMACGGDDEADRASTTTTASDTTTTSTTSTTESEPEATLPPAGALELEPIYGEALAELGLELTDRGGLIDRTGGGYEPSATGTHLALYVQPIDGFTVAQYIDGIRSVAAVFGDVFERWPGLASYDVCQEPVDEDGSLGDEPLPVTQIELTRAEADAIDWSTVTVVDLVRSSRAEPPGLALRVSSSLIDDPAFEAVVEEAS
jgi:hypothetical protein